MSIKTIYRIFMMGMVAISFPSCNGILGGIYDEPLVEKPAPKPEIDSHANDTLILMQNPYGFIKVDSAKHSGTLYIDASELYNWNYVDFEGKEVYQTSISADPEKELLMPDAWDFAMHRFDTKTNGGAALETNYTSLKQLVAAGKWPQGDYVTDVADTIIIDNSDMMNGNVVRVATPVNTELTKWMDLDLSNMPPTYTPSGKVYLVRNKQGKYAALHFVNYMNQKFQKGYLTIDYIYPLEF